MKKLILLILISSSAFSQTLDKKYIDVLSKRFKYNDLFVIVPVVDNDVNYRVLMTNNILHDYFIKKISHQSPNNYKDFLEKVFSKQKKIKIADIESNFYTRLPSQMTIFDEKEKYGLNHIIKKYLVSFDGKLRNKPLEKDNLNGLIKIMFDSGYLAVFSDYTGYFIFARP